MKKFIVIVKDKDERAYIGHFHRKKGVAKALQCYDVLDELREVEVYQYVDGAYEKIVNDYKRRMGF